MSIDDDIVSIHTEDAMYMGPAPHKGPFNAIAFQLSLIDSSARRKREIIENDRYKFTRYLRADSAYVTAPAKAETVGDGPLGGPLLCVPYKGTCSKKKKKIIYVIFVNKNANFFK